VAEIVLTAESPLGGYARQFGDTWLAEADGLAIRAAAIPLGGETGAEEALQNNGLGAIPAPGRYTSPGSGRQILRSAPDQLLMIFACETPEAPAETAALEPALWLTDLSDGHCVLDLDGPLARPALARLCPLDLHPEVFGPDHATRTVMEHIPATILRTGDETFRLISARSTARDFLHALEEAFETFS